VEDKAVFKDVDKFSWQLGLAHFSSTQQHGEDKYVKNCKMI